MLSETPVFDYSVFQYVKDTFYDSKECSIKKWIIKNIDSDNLKIITTTDSINDSIEDNLGAVSLILGELLSIERVNSQQTDKLSNDDSIIKFFSIKKFESNFNYIFISNNLLLREKISSLGFKVYTILEFEKVIDQN